MNTFLLEFPCIFLKLSINLRASSSGEGGGTGKNHRNNVRFKIGSNIFIINQNFKNCTYNIGVSEIMKQVYMENTITYNGIFLSNQYM